LERLTIAEAAKRLEVTQEAIRARIRRGTIEHDRDETDGKTYVYLDEDVGTNTVGNGVVNDYINALKSQIEQLERDRDEWREEAKRHQHIIMTLSSRLPEPQEEPKELPAGDRRPWWQRMFGGG